MGSDVADSLTWGCSSRREYTLFDQCLTEQHAWWGIDIKNLNGGSADAGLADESRTLPFKVTAPVIGARIK